MNLGRVRWGVRAVLTLGIAASVTANILHAQPNIIARSIAAWPPLALLLAIELISRVPVDRKWLAVLRMLATLTVAGIAAWVSYWHMQGVAARYGEVDAAPYLIPVSVDGLIVVASVCLVELGARVRVSPGNTNLVNNMNEVDGSDESYELTLNPALLAALAGNAAVAAMLEPVSSDVDVDIPTQPAMREVTADIAHQPAKAASSRGRKLPPSAADKVARIHNRNPDLTPAEIAAKVGVTESTVRRHLAPILRASVDPDASITGPTGQEINVREPVLTGATEGVQS